MTCLSEALHCNTFRIPHGQLPMSPAPMCHWRVKPKDTWHHMFPCVVMTAPGGSVIRDMSRPQLKLLEEALLEAAFHTIITSLVLNAFTLCCNIKQKMHMGCSLTFYNEIQEEHSEERSYEGKMYEQEETSSGVRTESRRREKTETSRRWRQREGEMRKTKGMWSSPSLCLAALWLKRRAPGERGGSRPAQSVLSLPWSPACRPQKHTGAKPSGRAPFYCTGSPIGS